MKSLAGERTDSYLFCLNFTKEANSKLRIIHGSDLTNSWNNCITFILN